MTNQTIDLQEFLERVQDDRELLLELFDIFTQDYMVKRKLLKEAVQKKNYEEIKGIAHSLKGASGNISAKILREIFLKMEDMGKAGNIDGIDSLLVALDQQYQDLLKRIDEIKDQLKG